MAKALFLDRDGTLIEDTGNAHKLEDLRLFPDTVEALKLARDQYRFYIITNQPGIARGLFTVEQFHAFNNKLVEELAAQGVYIEETRFCPHLEGCDCRKPSTKHLLELARKYGLDVEDSWVLGDHPSDVEMGVRAGCRTVYLLTGHGRKHLGELETRGLKPTVIASSLLEAVEALMNHGDQGNTSEPQET